MEIDLSVYIEFYPLQEKQNIADIRVNTQSINIHRVM